MEQGKLEQLLDTMSDLVSSDGPWRNKRDKILEIAKSNNEWDMALSEFLSWFPDEDEPTGDSTVQIDEEMSNQLGRRVTISEAALIRQEQEEEK